MKKVKITIEDSTKQLETIEFESSDNFNIKALTRRIKSLIRGA